jgi:hypothetical protein
VNDDFSNDAGVPAGPSAPNGGMWFCTSSRRGDRCELRGASGGHPTAVALWAVSSGLLECVEGLVGLGPSPFCLRPRSLGAPLEAVSFATRYLRFTFEARGLTLRFLSLFG